MSVASQERRAGGVATMFRSSQRASKTMFIPLFVCLGLSPTTSLEAKNALRSEAYVSESVASTGVCFHLAAACG